MGVYRQNCRVCTHADRVQIEMLHARGASARQIAKVKGISHWSVQRHIKNHVGAEMIARQPRLNAERANFKPPRCTQISVGRGDFSTLPQASARPAARGFIEDQNALSLSLPVSIPGEIMQRSCNEAAKSGTRDFLVVGKWLNFQRKFGGQGVNRTLDTKIFSLLLYRLSYLPTVADSARVARGSRTIIRTGSWGRMQPACIAWCVDELDALAR